MGIRKIVVDSDIETRKGVHADIAIARTKGGVTRIDFLLGDIEEEDSIRAALVSRVYMNNEDVCALRSALNSVQNADGGSDEA